MLMKMTHRLNSASQNGEKDPKQAEYAIRIPTDPLKRHTKGTVKNKRSRMFDLFLNLKIKS